MPTYEYECTKCGHRFELFQKMTDAPRKRCPRCRGAVRRLIGAGAGLIFKGSGFYITDYRSKDYHDKAKADSAAGTPPAKTETKESKPAPAPEKKTEKGADKKGSSAPTSKP
jgi:putative FmdB family regulatory protein